jgi:dienelactone hydrolase
MPRMKKALALLPVLVAFGTAAGQNSAHFEVPRAPVLTDEVVPIEISGLTRGHPVTITLRGPALVSRAVFVPDSAGRVDLARMAPKSGYDGVQPMGLFWFAKRESEATPREPVSEPVSEPVRVGNPPPVVWHLTAEQDGAVVATDTVLRRAVAADVRIRPVRASGLFGAVYQPPGNEPRPAVLVLGGSGGGLPLALDAPGGLASRGYVVLSLAYFARNGLPQELRDIPLEYFKRALDWLAAQPFVDSTRIAVMGASRGAEAALLIGSTYPQVHAVIAVSPSNVVVGSCCSDRFADAWTLNGSPVRRAEIPVENIRGPVLLISGRDDGVWPSTKSAESIVRRLNEHHFAHPVTNLSFPNAGHAISRPHSSTMEINSLRHPLTGRIMHMGGTPLGTALAREAAWTGVLDFLSAFAAR